MALLGAAVPLTVSACEPVLPLSRLLGSSTAIGSVIYVQSAVWLYLAIALKCVAFAYFERRLPLHQAAGFMLLANVVSTIPGMLIARFSRKAGGDLSFYTSVIRANYVTLGAILLVGAVAILPERLRSPGFLAAWLEQLWTSLPLG